MKTPVNRFKKAISEKQAQIVIVFMKQNIRVEKLNWVNQCRVMLKSSKYM
jgi:hypothetical protein